MNGETTIKFEINVAAQRIISQVVANNIEMQEKLEAGIKSAVDKFDFEEFSRKTVESAITDAIRSSSQWGSIRELAKRKADAIVDEYISKEMEVFSKAINEHLVTKNEYGVV